MIMLTSVAAAPFIRMNRAMQAALIAAWAVQGLGPLAHGAAEKEEIEVYRVDKKVSDFPAKDDFFSPEAAYATINRHRAAGAGDWGTMSTAKVRTRVPARLLKMKPLPQEEAVDLRDAQILAVRIFRGTIAQVSARMSRRIEYRSFEREDGRWLNVGAGFVNTEEEAAKAFTRWARERRELTQIQPRLPVDDPQAVLAPYVEYLQKEAVPPKRFVLDAVARHKLVAIGELHHRPTYWALNSDVVRDPRFARAAGTVYMELPIHAQELVDQFLAAEQLDTGPVIEMLRDNLWMGWPDQPMLDFFVAVWQTNQALDEAQRIRIVLVDMPRPWKELIREGNLRKYDTDRDKLMADNILRDMKRLGDKRHALFIVGYGHVEILRLAGADSPRPNSGWYLRQGLGAQMYSIVQHSPIIANMGKVFGRTCLGLFDDAFAANGNEPVAFSLADSPFGQQRFDIDGDRHEASMSLFAEAFDGYVYLGPLEDETFSPLIPGFYTDEFVKELDHRYRLMSGRGLVEGLRLPACDGRSFEEWMGGRGGSWGRPRKWKYFLGSVTAWRDGDDWESRVSERQHRLALEHPETITVEAENMFAILRSADRERLWSPDFRYEVHHHADVWIDWVVNRFTKDPIRTVDLGRVHADKQGRPAVPYTIILESGDRLTGVLPFKYYARAQLWCGRHGLDWHVKSE